MASRKQTPEGRVVNECLEWLAAKGYHILTEATDLSMVVRAMEFEQSKLGVFWRQNTGGAKLPGRGGLRPVRFGVPGQPDIAGIVRRVFPVDSPVLSPDGAIAQYVGIECKAAGGRLSDKQRAYRELVAALGGRVILAYGYEALEEAGL